MESQNQTTVSLTNPQTSYGAGGDIRGLPKLKYSGDPVLAEFFDVIVHQKGLSDTERMQYLTINVTGQAQAAFCGLVFSLQA